MTASIDIVKLESMILSLKELQQELKEVKDAELSLRKAVANMMLGCDSENDYTEARSTKMNIAGLKVTAATTENLEILDKDALVDLVLFGMLSDEEKEALKLKPDITIARARHLPDDSEILGYLVFKPSPTPTVKIEEL